SIEASFDEAQGLALAARVFLRNAQLLLQAAQLEVVARDLGDDGHLHCLQIARRGVSLGTLRVDAVAYASEQIQFPRQMRADVIALAGALAAGERCLVGAESCVARVRLCRHGRKTIQ